MSLFFTGSQIYGLLFLNWSGLYIIYLYWVELFFLSIYVIIRFWQLLQTEAKFNFRQYAIIPMKPDDTSNAMKIVVFTRVVFLTLYLFLIGISAVPYEHNYMNVKSVEHFFENLIIKDPLFLLAVFFVVYYYLKKIFSKVDQSPEELLEFSFNIDPLEARMISPGLAIFTIPVLLVFYLYIPELSSGKHSNLYLFAIWLLTVRILLEIHLVFRMKKERLLRGL